LYFNPLEVFQLQALKPKSIGWLKRRTALKYDFTPKQLLPLFALLDQTINKWQAEDLES
jgi:hypothetical protein